MKKIITFIIFIIIIIFIAKVYWQSLLDPVSPDQATKIFVIQKGEPIAGIAQRLEDQGLIRSSWVFKVALKLKKDAQVEAGDFKLSPSMPVSQIITTLEKGSMDKWVTLIEGWRMEEMAQRLSAELGIQDEEFLKSAKEGYMFPDTYLFNKDVAPSDIALSLENTFNQKYTKNLQAKIEARGLTAKEGVALASIVEREGRSDGVRTQIASILLKRLKIGMALNADATIQYALGYQEDEKTWWKKHLTYDDLKVKSDYNTYLHSGLPPGPICSPSLSSLRAVADADPSTPYLYYFHDSQGNSYYAKTLEEHNRNVANHR